MAIRIYRCHYCDVPMTKIEVTLDHIVPRGRGGVDERFNWVDACRDCNGRKADFWPSCRCNACARSRRRHWEMFKIRQERGEVTWPGRNIPPGGVTHWERNARGPWAEA